MQQVSPDTLPIARTIAHAPISRRTFLRLLAALPLLGAAAPLPARANDVVWDALRAGGHVALIRHAAAPGTGDPPNFTLDDCATQRNLSAGGRGQAVRLGEAFRANGVPVETILTSGWCRCIDTATLAFGTAEVWPTLHSFFRDAGTEAAQTADLRAGVASWGGPGTLVLVTHQVNVTALTTIFPAEGEVIVLAPAPDLPAGFTIVGRVAAF